MAGPREEQALINGTSKLRRALVPACEIISRSEAFGAVPLIIAFAGLARRDRRSCMASARASGAKSAGVLTSRKIDDETPAIERVALQHIVASTSASARRLAS